MIDSRVPTKVTNILTKVTNFTPNIIRDSITNIIDDSTTKVINTPTILITTLISLTTITKAKLLKRIILVHEVILKVSIYIIFNEKTFN